MKVIQIEGYILEFEGFDKRDILYEFNSLPNIMIQVKEYKEAFIPDEEWHDEHELNLLDTPTEKFRKYFDDKIISDKDMINSLYEKNESLRKEIEELQEKIKQMKYY